MGLTSILRKLLKRPKHGVVGETDPICPCCEIALERMPGRKKKCPGCGEFIYVRTRPSDRQRILITEEQIPLIEELWAIENGTHSQLLAKRQAYEDEKEMLGKRFGKEPSDIDIQWSLLNKSLVEYGQKRQMGYI
jgi:hypothetical protein